MRRALLAVVLALGCSKAGPKPVPEVPEPADLLLTVSMASPRGVLERAAAYADAVSRGSGQNLQPSLLDQALAFAVGAPQLSGLDLDKPLHLLLLDPKVHPRPVVLVGAVGDEAKLKATSGVTVTLREGRAAIGMDKAVAAAADYGFGLARKPAPTSPTLSLDPGKLVTRYRSEIDAFRAQMKQAMGTASPAMARVLDAEIDIFERIAEQTERLIVVADAPAAEATFELRLVPRPGTTFAAFNAAQKPGIDAALLALLPPVEKPSMSMVGRFEMGPARGPLLDLAAPLFEELTGKKLDAAERARWTGWLDLFDGRFAAVTWAGPTGAMGGAGIYGVSDGARAATQLRDLLGLTGERTFEVLGFKMSVAARPEAATHDGVAIAEYRISFDLSAFPEQQREMMRRMYGGDGLSFFIAGFDKTLAFSYDAAMMQKLIDAVRHPAPAAPRPPLAKAMETSSARKASVLAFLDLAQTMAPLVGHPMPASASGLTMEMGVDGGAWRMRVGMPAAHAQELGAAVGASPR